MTDNNKISFNKMRSIFFFSVIVILAIALIYIIRPFLYPIFWAAVIAVIFYPLYSKFLTKTKRPNLSASLTLIIVILVIIIPLSILSTLIVNESINVYKSVSPENISQKVTDIDDWLSKTSLAPYLKTLETEGTSYLTNLTKTISLFIFENLKTFTQNSFRFFFMLFIMFYTLFFFLRDGKKMLERLMHLSPLGNKYENMLYERFTSTTRATLKGTLLVGAVQGSLGGILFLITGIPGALIWGLVMIAMSIVPAVGCSIVWFPTGIIMLLMGNIWQGLFILTFGALVISLIDNLIRPPLVGKDTQIHPLLILFSTLGGIFLFGISGFVIGPVIASLFISVISIYDHYYHNELTNN
ncbi:MAG TPA: AI-2E family transporter [Candidatus Magasanikbacteria bacterium]|jgi:predicted PurR-regulated permease PerM|nr:AI-2E family transporter [Candidatus Magasanikbacteria bacterium]HQF57523.1 AI-2E family transporter [Candidatus Magasanikbacteria bacterium]HQL52979.1 AI-2E family transporter [Candidatus Magasanikbacteria bacterium]